MCDDKFGPFSFVDQLGVGLHPHPAAPFGQKPEHDQTGLPRFNHCQKKKQKKTEKINHSIDPLTVN